MQRLLNRVSDIIPPTHGKRVKDLLSALDDAEESVTATMEQIQKTIAKIIKAGRLLLVHRGEMAHGEWYDWLDVHCPGRDKGVLRRWMRLAEHGQKAGNELENAASVAEAYRLAGILPQLESGSGAGQKDESDPAFVMDWLRASSRLNAFVASNPVQEMPPDRRAALKQKLKPAVEPLITFYENL